MQSAVLREPACQAASSRRAGAQQRPCLPLAPPRTPAAPRAPSRSPRARPAILCQARRAAEGVSTKAASLAELPLHEALEAQLPRAAAKAPAAPRPRVVVLGSGWAAMSLIRALPADIKNKLDITVVSPRNFFLYTPLLPAVAVGTLEVASVVRPVRSIVHGKAEYYEAVCSAINAEAKEIVACFPADAGLGASACFKLPYDLLIMGVGATNNTFNIPGVAEHCICFKTIEDANSLRRRVHECFERAALPHTPAEERQRLLSFVCCGGGPTGIEVAAELHDMIFEDLKEHYPELMADVRIRVVEALGSVLSSYNKSSQAYTAKQLQREGIELVLNSRVTRVDAGRVTVTGPDGTSHELPFGACVWATGIAINPLAKQLQQLFPQEQQSSRAVLTDEFMRVLGSDGSILAAGDAASMVAADGAPRPLPATAQVAKQQGEWLAQMLVSARAAPAAGSGSSAASARLEQSPRQRPFAYHHKGSLAYVGADAAVVEVPSIGSSLSLAGREAGLLWRAYEVSAQFSLKNSMQVASDWLRSRLFGRDFSSF